MWRPFHVDVYMNFPSGLKRAEAAPTASGSVVTSETLSECVGAAAAGAASTSAAALPSRKAGVRMRVGTLTGLETGGEYTAAPHVREGPGRQSRRDRNPHHPRPRGAPPRLARPLPPRPTP